MSEISRHRPSASLFHLFSSLMAANTTAALAQVGIIVILSRLGSEETLGQFVFTVSVWSPVIMLVSLRLRSVIASDASREHKFSEYIGLQILAMFGAYVVVMTVFSVSSASSALWVTGLVGLAKLVEMLAESVYGLLQQCEDMYSIAVSKIARSVLGVISLMLGLIYGEGLIGGAFGLAIAGTLVLVAYDIPRARAAVRHIKGHDRRIRPQFHWNKLRPIIITALPLGVSSVLISLVVNVPRYFVKGILGDADLGVFGVMVYLVVAITLVMNAVCNAYLPRLSLHYAQKDYLAYRSLLYRLMLSGGAIGAVGILGAMVFGQTILKYFAGIHREGLDDAMTVIMIGGAVTLLAHAQQFALIAARRYRVQIPVVCADLVVTALACLVLVPRMELQGAAIAVLLGSIVRVFGFTVAVARDYVSQTKRLR